MFCISCGKMLPDNALFCPACGTRVGQTSPSVPPQADVSPLLTLKCTSCGSSNLKRLRAGEYRCEHCGTSFFSKEQSDREEDSDARLVSLLDKAEAYAEKGELQSEHKALATAYSLAPENNDVLLRYGRSYIKLGFPQKAMEYFRKAEALFPEDPVVYVNIGTALLKEGHFAEAKQQYEKGLSIIEADPSSASVGDAAVAYGNYALCVGRLGDRKTARKYLSIAKEKGYRSASIDWICRELHIPRFLI